MELKKINLSFKMKKLVLALGGQAKNTVCFARNNSAYLSSPRQNLSDPQDFLDFERSVKYFLKKKPKIIAYDLHPEYQSTKYAYELKAKSRQLRAIQHHHAHIASCMAENGLKGEKVIGVAFDGTGLGSDGKIWGAEFLICDYKTYRRRAHLRYIPLLGGEKAIFEPARVAFVWLYLIYGEKLFKSGIGWLKKMKPSKWRILRQMYLSGFNAVPASSMGRLFDASASIILGKQNARFEAELAIELEKMAIRYPCLAGRQALSLPRRQAGAIPASPAGRRYPFEVRKEGSEYIIDPLPMFRQILKDLRQGEAKEKMAYRFHLTAAEMIKNIALRLRKDSRINKVVLSGGVFQNNLLLGLSLDLLYKEDFKVFRHKQLSCNDSGISLGQAVIANFSPPSRRRQEMANPGMNASS